MNYDLFVIANTDLRKDVNEWISGKNISVYFIDEKTISSSELIKKKRPLPSCVFATTNDFRILSVKSAKEYLG